jgi:hypothetical protein
MFLLKLGKQRTLPSHLPTSNSPSPSLPLVPEVSLTLIIAAGAKKAAFLKDRQTDRVDKTNLLHVAIKIYNRSTLKPLQLHNRKINYASFYSQIYSTK